MLKITNSTRNQEIRALICQILSLIKIIVQSIAVQNIVKQVPLGLISNVSGAALDMEMTKPVLPGRVCADRRSVTLVFELISAGICTFVMFAS